MEKLLATIQFTSRELEILEYIVYGKTNPSIAEALAISVKTVEWHRLNLMKKIGAHKTADLVRYAYEHKIIRVPETSIRAI